MGGFCFASTHGDVFLSKPLSCTEQEDQHKLVNVEHDYSVVRSKAVSGLYQ